MAGGRRTGHPQAAGGQRAAVMWGRDPECRPRPGALSSTIEPPTASTRSRIVVNPVGTCGEVVPPSVEMPGPSSHTDTASSSPASRISICTNAPGACFRIFGEPDIGDRSAPASQDQVPVCLRPATIHAWRTIVEQTPTVDPCPHGHGRGCDAVSTRPHPGRHALYTRNLLGNAFGITGPQELHDRGDQRRQGHDVVSATVIRRPRCRGRGA
jgi:hypothetical protein